MSVLTQNFIDARGFGFVMIAILAGFTVAFRLLFANVQGGCEFELDEGNLAVNDCDKDPFGSLSQSMLSTFELAILGSYEPSILRDSRDEVLAGMTFVIAVTVVLVVALNALIAVLGDSFSRVQQNATANRRRERAELIVGYLAMMPRKRRSMIENNTNYFHTLLASDGHGDLLLSRGDWQGGLNLLKRELTEMIEANNEDTQRTIGELRSELVEEIGTMSSVLNDIAMEVKEISHMRQNSPAPRNTSVAVRAIQTIGRNLPFEGIRKTLLPSR